MPPCAFDAAIRGPPRRASPRVRTDLPQRDINEPAGASPQDHHRGGDVRCPGIFCELMDGSPPQGSGEVSFGGPPRFTPAIPRGESRARGSWTDTTRSWVRGWRRTSTAPCDERGGRGAWPPRMSPSPPCCGGPAGEDTAGLPARQRNAREITLRIFGAVSP
jgi:hypothetical protein